MERFIMKNLFSLALLLTLILSFSERSSIQDGAEFPTFPGFDTSAGTTDPSSTVTSGVTCSGTTEDGDGSGTFKLANYNIRLGGQEAWYPQKNDTLLYPQTEETRAIFTSDGRLQARIRVLPQPEPIVALASGEQVPNCEGRLPGADNNLNPSQGSAHRYERLSFDVNFYHSRLENGRYVRTTTVPFFSQNVQGIDVNKCSNVIEVSSFQLASTNEPILVEVANVRTDMFCAISGQFCPSERGARAQECYNVVLQVANDNTDGFK